MINKIINNIKSLFIKSKTEPFQETPTVGGYVFWHTRGNDVVLIGPFTTLDTAREWYDKDGERLGVSPILTHTRYPANTYNGIWGLMPEEQFDSNYDSYLID